MKFNSFTALCAAVLAPTIFMACDDTVSQVGSSLAGANVEILIDSSFTATGHTVLVPSIQPKTTDQLIGKITIPAYGTLASSVVTQFLPSTALDTEDFTYENVDSIFLNLRYARGGFIGDSVAPMGITVYELTRQLPSNISSTFDPEGFYNPSSPLASTIYNASTLNSSTEDKVATTRAVDIKLPVEFGRRLFKAYEDKPESYASGQTFSSDVLPGLYLESSYGNGRMTCMSVCAMTMYLRKIYTPEGEEKPDTLDATHLYYLVTPEVVSNNDLTYTMGQELRDMIADGHTMLIAPAGSEIEFTFPAPEILAAYRRNSDKIAVINGLAMTIPVDTIECGMAVEPPPYALMVLKKDRDEFFAKNKLTDNITSFYATYNSTSRTYNFNSLRSYLTSLLDKEEITPDDCTFSLVPVQVSFENLVNTSYYSTTTQQTESEIQPYLISPAMADVKINEAKIKFTYSLQTQK